eukprot:TRINITY_DN63191_c0_g1_i1.p1 TRINITY_DN63191_c0_g1~~TRINITY_DN63191_c0_g1_i1.p1  ORF type:complete len:249 (-),score=33.15 TRINITY_DN63191_c0_g1_i1:146-892(-)
MRTRLSESPLIELLPSVLEDHVCDELLALGARRFQNPNSSSTFSSSLYLREPEDFRNPLLCKVAAIASSVAGLPLDCAEPISITRYCDCQQYDWHYDDVYLERLATCIFYLTSISAGGETAFPLVAPTPVVATNQLPSVAEFRPEKLGDWPNVVSVSPKRGNVVLFYNRDKNNVRDERSLHGSLPIVSSSAEEKWICQVWLHAKATPGQTGDWCMGEFQQQPSRSIASPLQTSPEDLDHVGDGSERDQ